MKNTWAMLGVTGMVVLIVGILAVSAVRGCQEVEATQRVKINAKLERCKALAEYGQFSACFENIY